MSNDIKVERMYGIEYLKDIKEILKDMDAREQKRREEAKIKSKGVK